MIKSLSTTLSTVDTFLGPGLLHPFPINNGQCSGGSPPTDSSPWNTDQGSLMGC